MLEIRPSRAALVACMGDAGTLDRVTAPTADSCVFRVAPDERWLVGPPGQAAELLAGAAAACASQAHFAFALEMADAWSLWTITGPDADEMWARLSDNAIPSARPAFVQGAVAMVPAKALALDECIHVFVPAPVSHYFPPRVLAACKDLQPRIVGAIDWVLRRPAFTLAGPRPDARTQRAGS